MVGVILVFFLIDFVKFFGVMLVSLVVVVRYLGSGLVMNMFVFVELVLIVFRLVLKFLRLVMSVLVLVVNFFVLLGLSLDSLFVMVLMMWIIVCGLNYMCLLKFLMWLCFLWLFLFLVWLWLWFFVGVLVVEFLV